MLMRFDRHKCSIDFAKPALTSTEFGTVPLILHSSGHLLLKLTDVVADKRVHFLEHHLSGDLSGEAPATIT